MKHVLHPGVGSRILQEGKLRCRGMKQRRFGRTSAREVAAWLVALSLLGCLCSKLLGQENRGSIIGRVTDQSGATVPGARVRTVNIATGVAAVTQSNTTGNYSLPFLPPGTYRVSVNKTGFVTAVNQAVRVNAQQTLPLDFVLKVGSVSQQVSVSARAPMLEAASASTGQTISTESISQLPMLNRNISSLALLGPGMNQNPNFFGSIIGGLETGGVAATGNGLRDESNQFTIDGANVNVGMYNYPSFVPVPEAVDEFDVQTGTYPAEYGDFAGSHVNYVLKSGTNSFHGSAWEFLQNNAFDARNFFSPTVPPLRQNQFGGELGGPIKKNKTFFMATYQGLRESSQSFIENVVPSVAQRSGDLAQNPGGTLAAPFIDPTTGKPFPGDIIPASRIVPQSKTALQLLAPLPNQPGAVNWGQFISFPQFANDVLAKIDHSFSDKDNFSGRYMFHNSSILQTTCCVGQFATSTLPIKSQDVALIETHTFSPSVVVASRVSWNRQTLDELYPQVGSRLNTRQVFGMLIPSSIAPGDPMNAYPYFSISGYGGLGETGNIPLYQPDENYEIASDLALIEGKHTLKTGFETFRFRSVRFVNDNTNGETFFAPTNPAGTGSALADFLLGLPSESTIASIPITVDLRRTEASFYLDDKWAVSPKLTLDLGLRYELHLPTNEHFGRVPLFNFTPPGSFETLSPGEGLYLADFDDFAPRFGIAYRVSPGTVIRTGYGMYYDTPDQLWWTFKASNPPFITTETFFAAAGQPLGLADPYPLGLAAAGGVPSPAAYQFNPGTPTVNEWTFDVQHSFGRNLLLDVGYVGNRAYGYPRTTTLNVPLVPGTGAIQSRRPLLGFGPIAYMQFDSPSTYEALQVKVEKRFSRGLSFLASYTWSKNLDIASNGANGATVIPTNLNIDYGPSDYDVPQNLTLSWAYDLPVGRGRRFLSSGRLSDLTLGGWELSGVATLASGYPMTITYPGDVANVGLGTRPVRVCNGGLGSRATVNEWFDVACFTGPAPFTFGNSGRGVLFGPSTQTWNIALMKDFHTYENQYLQFRAEFYNAFNNVNLGQPISEVGVPGAGQITSAGPARIIQFGLEYNF
jgi:hypothetical protein